jgi:hypothetical protein
MRDFVDGKYVHKLIMSSRKRVHPKKEEVPVNQSTLDLVVERKQAKFYCYYCKNMHLSGNTNYLQDETLRACPKFSVMYQQAEQKQFDEDGFVVPDDVKIDVFDEMIKVAEEEEALNENWRNRRLKKIIAPEDKLSADLVKSTQEFTARQQDAKLLKEQFERDLLNLFDEQAAVCNRDLKIIELDTQQYIDDFPENEEDFQVDSPPCISLSCTDERYNPVSGEIEPIEVVDLGGGWAYYTTVTYSEPEVLNYDQYMEAEEERASKRRRVIVYDANDAEIMDITLNHGQDEFLTADDLDAFIAEVNSIWGDDLQNLNLVEDEFDMNVYGEDDSN